MKDKDNRLNLNLLKEICNELVLTKTSQIRNESLENLNKISHDLGYENIKTTSNLDEAMNYILNANNDCLVIGSFFLVSEAILALKVLNQGSIGLDVFSNS
jgi:folylpolyglutamate synthase/dihydropteroate synthase